MDIALKDAEAQSKTSNEGSRDFNSSQGLSSMMSLLSQVPGTGDLARQAQDLQAMSDIQEQQTSERPYGAGVDTRFAGPPGSVDGPPGPNIPGTNIDPMKTAAQIYPYVFGCPYPLIPFESEHQDRSLMALINPSNKQY